MATWKRVGEQMVKVTTNLTKLEVAKNPQHSLGLFYGKTLRTLAKMPQDYPYRKHTEQIINERAALVKSTPDLQELEAKIGCGQVEELIMQAEYELEAARNILENRAWEPLVSAAPENQWKWPI